jgi:hypothetical protein
MEWMHFWIGLGFLLNFIGIIAMWWSDSKDGWVTVFQDDRGDNIVGGMWIIITIIATLFGLMFGLAEAPTDTWNVILATLGCASVTAAASFLVWGIVEFINATMRGLNRAERNARETIKRTQTRIVRNRERRAALRESGKLRRNMKDSNVLVRVSGYHNENMEALPKEWVGARHELTSLYEHVEVVLRGRRLRGKDLTKAARDAKRHKGAKPDTPEYQAHLRAVEHCDFFKGRRRALGALTREIEAFLDGIELEIAKHRPDANGEEIILGKIAEFCKKNDISLKKPLEPEEPEEDDLMKQAKAEVDGLTAEIDQVLTSTSSTTSTPKPDRKKQAGARKQRQGA